MPLSNSAIDALGFATLLLVLALCCVGVFCVGYVLHFRSKIHNDNLFALRDFNSLWVVRLILILFAVLWGLGELLRLPLLRKKGWLLHKLGFRWQANTCKLYILSSLGVLEPCFFLTALFLVQGSLRSAPFTPRRRWNGKVVGLVLGFCAPVFLVQVFLLVVTPAFWMKSQGFGRLPGYFTKVYEEMKMDSGKVAVCTYPLFSTIVLGMFGCIYVVYFLYLGWRMLSLVINRRLQLRVYGLVLAVVLLLPVHVLFLGLTVLSRPSEPLFEAVGFLGFLTVLLCTSVGEGILVIRPIADALAVRWTFQASPKTTGGSSSRGFWNSSSVEHFVIPLTVPEEVCCDVQPEVAPPFSSSQEQKMLRGVLVVSPPASPRLPGKPLVSYTNRILL